MKNFTIFTFILLFSVSISAQKPKDVATGGTRAQKSAEIVRQFSALGIDSVPLEYLLKAKAVAVFPGLTKVNILLSELITGNGIVAIRNGDDWSAPVFLAFKGTDINFGIAGKKSFDTVFLFMDDESIGWLKKGDFGFNSNSKSKVLLGPVIGGKGTERTMQEANLIYYTFDKGQIVDRNLSNDAFFKAFAILHDNNLNKAIFGMKTKPLLAAPEANIKIPDAVEEFRKALKETNAKKNEAEKKVETIVNK